MSLIKIIIIDDSATFREGLKFYCEKILSYMVIAEVSNGNEFLQLDNSTQADIILIDIDMPLQIGIDKVIKEGKCYLNKMIALTSFDEKVYLNQFLHSGFKGYVSKTNLHKDLKKAIEAVTGIIPGSGK